MYSLSKLSPGKGRSTLRHNRAILMNEAHSQTTNSYMYYYGNLKWTNETKEEKEVAKFSVC